MAADLVKVRKGKEKKTEYLYSACSTSSALETLRHGSHSFTCKLHHACPSFVTIHQMAPPMTDAAYNTYNSSSLLIYRPWRDERLSWPGRLTSGEVVTRQLQVERRTGKVCRPETDVLPLCYEKHVLVFPPFPSLYVPMQPIPTTTPSPTHIPLYLFHFHPLAGFCLKVMDRWTDLVCIIVWWQPGYIMFCVCCTHSHCIIIPDVYIRSL